MVYSDRRLSQRLECAEGAAAAKFVEANARLHPDRRAEWKTIGGAYALFDGADSPITQAFGFGVIEPPTPETLAELERFFSERAAPVQLEISPMAHKETWTLLENRGYWPVEWSSVLYLPASLIQCQAIVEPSVKIAGDRESWIKTATEGWSSEPGVSASAFELMRVMADRSDVVLFLAEVYGQPAAAAALVVNDGVGLLAGAATIPQARGRGAQRALLEARLQYCASSGCDLAMMVAEAGSSSQRNAERVGFRIAYTRTKWSRPA